MQPLKVSVRGIERSGALEARMREVGDRLRRCDQRITQCSISVIKNREGSMAVKIALSLPGALVHADGAQANGDPDVFVALRSAYDSARRQLRDLHDGRDSRLLNAVRDSKGR
jgi:ribosome-associated translation inhibitor RaiA